MPATRERPTEVDVQDEATSAPTGPAVSSHLKKHSFKTAVTNAMAHLRGHHFIPVGYRRATVESGDYAKEKRIEVLTSVC